MKTLYKAYDTQCTWKWRFLQRSNHQSYHRQNDLHDSTVFECIFRFVFLTVINSVSLNYMFLNNKVWYSYILFPLIFKNIWSNDYWYKNTFKWNFHFHIFKMIAWYLYFKVCQWKTLINCDMDPCKWGWKLENGKMCPIMTDQVIINLFWKKSTIAQSVCK